MKKILFIIFCLLLIAWCWSEEKAEEFVVDSNSELIYQKQKDCFNFKSKYIDYLYKKHNLSKDLNISELKKQWKSFKILNNDEQIFYSESEDKCLWAYRIIRYDPIYENWELSCYSDEWFYYIDDIINDENLYANSEISSDCYWKTHDDMIEENRQHLVVLNDWKSEIEKYRWKKVEKTLWAWTPMTWTGWRL